MSQLDQYQPGELTAELISQGRMRVEAEDCHFAVSEEEWYAWSSTMGRPKAKPVEIEPIPPRKSPKKKRAARKRAKKTAKKRLEAAEGPVTIEGQYTPREDDKTPSGTSQGPSSYA